MKQRSDKELPDLLSVNSQGGMAQIMEQYAGLLWAVAKKYLTNPDAITKHQAIPQYVKSNPIFLSRKIQGLKPLTPPQADK